MGDLHIQHDALETLGNFQLPKDLSFGQVMIPVMVEASFENGSWGEAFLRPYQAIALDPSAKVLHYGQEIFEGMKAYRNPQAGPFLFRPRENFERFNRSARRMAMPEVPPEIFLAGLEELVARCAQLIPTGQGDSLYLRPFMFASEGNLGIKPSREFRFLIVASPVCNYFAGTSVALKIERQAARAATGGVGQAKTGGNYAASLRSMIKAKEQGLDQVLWLDAATRECVEELSGMNFFAVHGEVLVTPKLTDTILDGITRRSILQLAPRLGLRAREEVLPISDLIAAIEDGSCTEMFACGTAVIVTPIGALGEEDGRRYCLKAQGMPVTERIRRSLLDIQEGRAADPFGWRHSIKAL